MAPYIQRKNTFWTSAAFIWTRNGLKVTDLLVAVHFLCLNPLLTAMDSIGTRHQAKATLLRMGGSIFSIWLVGAALVLAVHWPMVATLAVLLQLSSVDPLLAAARLEAARHRPVAAAGGMAS